MILLDASPTSRPFAVCLSDTRSPMITPIDVIDTAVKIGLGTILSALGMYLQTRFSHKKEMEKAYLNRRAFLLEGIAEQVQKFTIAALAYWAALAEQNDYINTNLPESLQHECEERTETLIRT